MPAGVEVDHNVPIPGTTTKSKPSVTSHPKEMSSLSTTSMIDAAAQRNSEKSLF